MSDFEEKYELLKKTTVNGISIKIFTSENVITQGGKKRDAILYLSLIESPKEMHYLLANSTKNDYSCSAWVEDLTSLEEWSNKTAKKMYKFYKEFVDTDTNRKRMLENPSLSK